MKIEVEIPEEEIQEAAKKIISEHVAGTMISSAYGDGRFYRNTIKEVIRECIREDIDNLSARAVEAAAKSIENRAVKKLIEKLEAAE